MLLIAAARYAAENNFLWSQLLPLFGECLYPGNLLNASSGSAGTPSSV
jgi:hypothetical protein